jgi:1-acyl-sn-glycerol-3-phosphate acyltransferase
MDARERALLAVNTLDILSAVGCRELRFMRRWLELAIRGPALAFARQVIAFDDAVAAQGITHAARALLAAYVSDISVQGDAHIPGTGPVLIVSNHPGLTDTAALFAAIPRPDIRVLAADRSFFHALPAFSRALIFISDDPRRRMTAMRSAIGHLKSGGALLTFPAGEIEPDPAVLPGALHALGRWSSSTATFLRFVPQAAMVPVVVSGVLSAAAQRHPLTRLRRKRKDREWLGAILQIMARTFFADAWRVRARVDILEPFSPGELAGRREEATRLVCARVADFLRARARA